VAKKSRTPAPPRPVQAPKKRSEPRRTPGGRTRLWIAVAAGALLLVGAGGAIAFAMTRDSGGSAASGPCQIRTLPSQGSNHVERLPNDFEPNSFPRTSGPHHPQTVVYGEYTDPVPQLNLVHNLEHGAVAIQYGPDVSPETIQRLQEWYRIDPRGLVLAPLPNVEQAARLRDKIALTAWTAELEDESDPSSEIVSQEGVLAICSGFDRGAFDDFVESYRAKGPERFQLDDLQPGSP
jgi:uncharacterized protein DUF3105